MGKTKYIQLPISGAQEPAKTKVGEMHLKGMYKLAAVILPGESKLIDFPSVKPEEHIHGMIDYMYPDDRGAILVLLKIFAIVPKFFIVFIMHMVEAGAKWNGASGSVFRMLQVALKGLIFTLYYSDFTEEKVIHGAIGYDAKIVWK